MMCDVILRRARPGLAGLRPHTGGLKARALPCRGRARHRGEREFFIDNVLVRIHLIIVIIRWTGLARIPVAGGLGLGHLQGYLAHKKQPPPPRTTLGP